VQEVLLRVEERYPNEPLRIISALAEGADRIVARQVLARPNSRLIVPLPLAVDDYLNDFGSDDSKAEFLRLLEGAEKVVEPPAARSREEAYGASGEYVLDHSDVLVAVWDGQAEQGRSGTGAIVARARQKGMPIAWVHAGNRKPGTHEPTSLGQEQGKVTLENF
jgi:hypothetical protein